MAFGTPAARTSPANCRLLPASADHASADREGGFWVVLCAAQVYIRIVLQQDIR